MTGEGWQQAYDAAWLHMMQLSQSILLAWWTALTLLCLYVELTHGAGKQDGARQRRDMWLMLLASRVSAVEACSSSCLASGSYDGLVRLWDGELHPALIITSFKHDKVLHAALLGS